MSKEVKRSGFGWIDTLYDINVRWVDGGQEKSDVYSVGAWGWETGECAGKKSRRWVTVTAIDYGPVPARNDRSCKGASLTDTMETASESEHGASTSQLAYYETSM